MHATDAPDPSAASPSASPAGGAAVPPRAGFDAAQLVARYRRAKERRTPWEAHWQACVDNTLPQRDGAVGAGEPGQRKGERLFDATAGDAAEQLAASLLAELTPPWSRWIGLGPGPKLDGPARAALAPRLGEAEEVLQGHLDRSNFAVEMQLEPANVADGRLDPDRLVPYDGELIYAEGNQEAVLTLLERRLVSAACWWDPAYGAPDAGDASAVAAVFLDAAGRVYLHRVTYLEHDPARLAEVDEATQQCRLVRDVARTLHLPFVALETNGLGRFLPGLLRRELNAAEVPCAVREVANRRPKDLRILEAFDAPLAAGALHAHASVLAGPLVREMREWRPGTSGGRDDGLDAVAGCLALEPARLPRLPAAGRARWRPGSGGVRAPADFDV